MADNDSGQATATEPSRRIGRGVAAVTLAGALAVVGCTSTGTNSSAGGGAAGTTAGTTPGTLATRPAPVQPRYSRAEVDAAVAKLDPLAQQLLDRSGVPGMAFAVVYDDQVVATKGYGVREVGKPDKVDADTIFQLASLSKPIASTVVAGVVGDGAIAWDDPVVAHDPTFALKDPYVSEHVTYADLFSHRSGLPDHAGDLLEDLGYDRQYILEHLRLMPLTPFRSSYAYTNFVLTEAGVAAANASGTTWEDLSAKRLYGPLGMTSTSSRFEDFANAPNHATIHAKVGDHYEAKYVRQPDAQSPAGGVSSSVKDLAQWLRLQLGQGTVGGKQIVDAKALGETHIAHSVATPPRSPDGPVGYYGLGWNVGDDSGRLKLSHSGAFSLGTGTAVTMVPADKLAIVALTNGAPSGVPEALNLLFFDLLAHGQPTVDWLPAIAPVIEQLTTEGRSPTDYATPPAGAAAPQPAATYEGTYQNSFYGPLTVKTGADGRPVMVLGPKAMEFPLTPYDGNTFSYQTTGENAVGLSGVTFTVAGGRATSVVLENLDHEGLGTFTR